ncbi:MAG: hypothetical protein KDD45_16645, partial [Bdellovibrionales bacterium]|nr:hypothetical protein [Bdellovibrionales bacterium]
NIRMDPVNIGDSFMFSQKFLMLIPIIFSFTIFTNKAYGLGATPDQLAKKQLDQKIKEAQEDVKKAQQRVATAQRSLNRAKTNHANCIKGLSEAESFKKCTKGKATYDLDFQEYANSQLQSANAKLTEAEAKLKELNDSNLKITALTQIGTTRGAITTTSLEVSSTASDIDKFTRELDKEKIAKYLLVKMGLLINSQSFCEAKKRCELPTGQTKIGSHDYAVDSNELARDVFSSDTLKNENSIINFKYWEEGQSRLKRKTSTSSK